MYLASGVERGADASSTSSRRTSARWREPSAVPPLSLARLGPVSPARDHRQGRQKFFLPDPVGIRPRRSSCRKRERFRCSTPSFATTTKTSSAPGARRRTTPSWPSSPWCRRSSTRQGKLGPVARLLPTTAATTLRKDQEPPLVIDGPFAETKEQLLGFYIVDCADLEEALEIARELGRGQSRAAPTRSGRSACSMPGSARRVTDLAWIDAALTSARPQAVGALLRYFRDLDTAEEAFQEACLRALKTWPQNGPPRDPAAWLIMVGRNAALDEVRRRKRKQEPLPDEDDDLRSRRRRRRRSPSGSTARTTATTSCGCCSSAAIPTCRRRSRSRWRCASSPGLSVKQIARAFLVERERDGAAHHARQGARSPRPTCRSRRRARSSAPSGSPPSRR